jgi:hypothetical protein
MIKVKIIFSLLMQRAIIELGFFLYRVEQRKRMFFKWLVLGNGGVDDVGREPADSSDNAGSVAMAHWNVCLPSSSFLETVIP